MTTRPRSKHVTAGPQGPALTGSGDDALLQAMRNLWPILSPAGRRQATTTAEKIKGGK